MLYGFRSEHNAEEQLQVESCEHQRSMVTICDLEDSRGQLSVVPSTQRVNKRLSQSNHLWLQSRYPEVGGLTCVHACLLPEAWVNNDIRLRIPNNCHLH